MYIRFEVAGTGLWMAGTCFLEKIRGRWRPLPEPGTREMSRRARDRYFDLLGVLLTGIKAPPGGVYAVAEGFRTRTYFTPVEANRANINAGWEMITLLRQHGHRAYEVFAHRPRGRVVFTDDRQIVVLERAPRRSDAGWSGDRTTIRRERGRAMIDFIHKMRGDVGCLGLK